MTDMPDVIYATDKFNWHREREYKKFKELFPMYKYIRADLVPAAPTGDKAKARQLFETIINVVTLHGTCIDYGAIATIRSVLQSNTPVIPEGWRLVPVEPTREMNRVADMTGDAWDVYKAMLAAAPTYGDEK